MLLSGVTPSLGGPGFGDKHSRSGIFGLGGGGTDFDRSSIPLLLRGKVGRDKKATDSECFEGW